jgi:hypothetical protein
VSRLLSTHAAWAEVLPTTMTGRRLRGLRQNGGWCLARALPLEIQEDRPLVGRASPPSKSALSGGGARSQQQAGSARRERPSTAFRGSPSCQAPFDPLTGIPVGSSSLRQAPFDKLRAGRVHP